MKVRFLLLGLVVMLAMCAAPVAADQWYIANGNPTPVVFTFDGTNLSLSTDFATWNYPTYQIYALYHYGAWAVCGQVVDNALVADPYASFVSAGGWSGYVDWAPDTPAGYTTSLLLGASFQGNGAQTLGRATGTLILDTMESQYNEWFANAIDHSFTTTYVPTPEPTGVVTVLCGLAGMAGVLRRRKR